VLALVAAVGAAFGMSGLLADPPAFAAPTATVMATTQRMSDATLTSTQAGWYNKGQVLTLVCYKRGQAVKGYYSPYLPNGGWDDLWYKTGDGYFAADVDINTGSNSPVTPACSSTSPAGTGAMSLPFQAGTAVAVTQSPNSGPTHNDAYNSTAVDWKVGSGTPVVASAAGTIYFEGWTTGSYAPAGIMVLIDHGSDNCTQYAHLSRTVIDKGQRVLKGQLIGYSGGSGYNSQTYWPAHLHWAGVSCQTQQAKFVVNTAEAGTTYTAGATYTSRNNGDDLLNPRSNRCLDVAGGNTASGTPVQLYDCNGTNAQKWLYTSLDPKPLKVFGTRCLDVQGGRMTSGTKVQSYACNGTAAQKWNVNQNGTITTWNGLCLDAVGGGTANGTRIQIYTCNGTGAQVWR